MIRRLNFNDGYTSEITPTLSVPAGHSIYTGPDSPLDSQFNDGDVYLRSNGEIYVKVSGIWVLDSQLTLGASNISNSPTGNLSSIDQQSVNDELQEDIDSINNELDSLTLTVSDNEATLLASLATHASEDSGIHGITGSIVGTTDTQTLSNKTLSSPSIHSPSRLDVKKDTKAALTSYASTASNGQLVFATDEKEMFQVIDGTLKPVGGFVQLEFALQNNQSTPTDVTGLLFNSSSFRSFKALVTIEINATASLFESKELLATFDGTSWGMTAWGQGQDSGVELDITSLGQITYTSSNYPGFTSGKLKLKITTLSI
jgi:hypothetical protein